MKKQIQIVGISHRTGVSKQGKEYDFYVLHGTYKDVNTEGMCTFSATIPDSEATDVVVGETVTVFTYFYNGKEYINAILR